MALHDPFYVVKAEIEQALGATRLLRESFRKLLNNTNTASNDEFTWTCDQLRDNLKNVEEDLADLEETITIVEKNPTKFKLDPIEIKSRKTFIGDTRIFIQDIRTELSSPATKGKMERDRREDLTRQKLKSAHEEKFAAVKREHDADNQRFLDGNGQQALIARQDERLDQTAESVGRLKNIAVTINDELTSQNTMLEELDAGVDRTSGRLKSSMQKMAQIYKNNKDGKSLLFIGFLVVVVVVLGILALTI